MDIYFLEQLYSLVLKNILNFYHSAAFSIIKFLLGVYLSVIIINIILLLAQRLQGDLRVFVSGADIPPELTVKKGKLRKRWEKIRAKLESENESEYKVAVIQADCIAGEIIEGIGYAGGNTGERLRNILPGQVENLEGLRQAHETRNRIIHEEGFQIGKDEAERILEIYESFLREMQALD